jgi:ribosomal-protein-alanine acetyltransferase
MNREDSLAAVRPMTVADLDRVAEIAAGLRQAPKWPRSAYEAILDPEKPSRIALVAEEPEDRIAGFLVALVAPPEIEVESIAVVRECQRKGVGRLLFKELTRVARPLGLTEVALEVRASNREAIGFYQALGLVEVARRTCYYIDPKEDAVLMRLKSLALASR